MLRQCAKSALLAALVAAGLVGGSCGGGDKPSSTPPGYPDAASLIPTAPAPQPTPTPTPGFPPADDPLPATPGRDAGVSGSCGPPAPPPVSRWNVKVHGRQSDRVLLDSTPLVGPDVLYCRQIGYDDGRAFCPVRLEGHPERQACETARVGRASDTGRPGPTWSANGKRCNGPDGGAACLNHADNQYLVFAYGPGTFRACAASGVCGEIALP